MRILVTNDDGINSDGLWVLARELREISQVTIVVPDSERSAIGTAVSLFKPLRVEEATPEIEGVAAYVTDGTPADCTILAMGKLIEGNVDLVISGINAGLNLGEDVYISGTVGGALQGYFRGSSAMSVSAPRDGKAGYATAAKTAAALAKRVNATALPSRIFLNVNTPDIPITEIAGVRITRLAQTSHINTVEEADTSEEKHYHLFRQQIGKSALKGTDMHAVKQGFISITPLFTNLFNRPPQRLLQELCADIV
jgi:5'-nucleotidase